MMYFKCFWLFVFGCLLGVAVETLWWRVRYGFWQCHFTLLWFPFCTVYGFGAVGCYLGALLLAGQNLIVRFLTFSFVGTAIEFAGGFLLDCGMQMRAWDYRGTFLNIRGYVNLLMAVIWGVLGLGFELLIPGIDRLFFILQGGFLQAVTFLFTAFLMADILTTSASLARWSRRHQGIEARTTFEHFLDRKYNDEKMHRRFINWHFNDEPDFSRTRPEKHSSCNK